MRKRILAPSQERLATPPKPKKAAIKAITRNRTASRNMVGYSFLLASRLTAAPRTRFEVSLFCTLTALAVKVGSSVAHSVPNTPLDGVGRIACSTGIRFAHSRERFTL